MRCWGSIGDWDEHRCMLLSYYIVSVPSMANLASIVLLVVRLSVLLGVCLSSMSLCNSYNRDPTISFKRKEVQTDSRQQCRC